ncbi:MAG: hypothetical protein ACTSUT_06935 [Promethearchaeota archaeon]
MEKEEFLRILPKLIRENDEVKGAIITALSGVVSTKTDIEKIIEHSDKRFEAMDKRFEAMDKRFEAMDKRFEVLIEQMNKGFEEARKERKKGFEDASKERKLLDVKISSIGSRGGGNLQDLILNLLQDKLIQENIIASEIKRERIHDLDEIFYGKNYNTDINVLIQNGKTILIEIKYNADNFKLHHFVKNAELFKHQFKKDYDELIMICLEINEINLKLAEKLGVKVITGKVV